MASPTRISPPEIARAPDSATAWMYLRLLLYPCDGVTRVPHPCPRASFLTRLARAGATVTMVEHHHRHSRSSKLLGERVEVHYLDRPLTLRHHSHGYVFGRAVEPIIPTLQHRSFGVSLSIRTHPCPSFPVNNCIYSVAPAPDGNVAQTVVR